MFFCRMWLIPTNYGEIAKKMQVFFVGSKKTPTFAPAKRKQLVPYGY